MSARGFRIHPAASEELDAAGQWYDEQLPGLSFELLNEIDDAIQRIVERPGAWQQTDLVVGHTIRRFVMRRFPFSLVYCVSETLVCIIAVAHAKRTPGYWRARVKDAL